MFPSLVGEESQLRYVYQLTHQRGSTTVSAFLSAHCNSFENKWEQARVVPSKINKYVRFITAPLAIYNRSSRLPGRGANISRLQSERDRLRRTGIAYPHSKNIRPPHHTVSHRNASTWTKRIGVKEHFVCLGWVWNDTGGLAGSRYEYGVNLTGADWRAWRQRRYLSHILQIQFGRRARRKKPQMRSKWARLGNFVARTDFPWSALCTRGSKRVAARGA